MHSSITTTPSSPSAKLAALKKQQETLAAEIAELEKAQEEKAKQEKAEQEKALAERELKMETPIQSLFPYIDDRNWDKLEKLITAGHVTTMHLLESRQSTLSGLPYLLNTAFEAIVYSRRQANTTVVNICEKLVKNNLVTPEVLSYNKTTDNRPRPSLVANIIYTLVVAEEPCIRAAPLFTLFMDNQLISAEAMRIKPCSDITPYALCHRLEPKELRDKMLTYCDTALLNSDLIEAAKWLKLMGPYNELAKTTKLIQSALVKAGDTATFKDKLSVVATALLSSKGSNTDKQQILRDFILEALNQADTALLRLDIQACVVNSAVTQAVFAAGTRFSLATKPWKALLDQIALRIQQKTQISFVEDKATENVQRPQ